MPFIFFGTTPGRQVTCRSVSHRNGSRSQPDGDGPRGGPDDGLSVGVGKKSHQRPHSAALTLSSPLSPMVGYGPTTATFPTQKVPSINASTSFCRVAAGRAGSRWLSGSQVRTGRWLTATTARSSG